MVVMFLCDTVIGTVVLVITLLLYLFVSYRKLGEFPGELLLLLLLGSAGGSWCQSPPESRLSSPAAVRAHCPRSLR